MAVQDAKSMAYRFRKEVLKSELYKDILLLLRS